MTTPFHSHLLGGRAAVSLTAYCPTCRKDALVRDGRCVWCDGEVRTRIGKRLGVHGKLSDDQLRELHSVHDTRGVSMRAIARAIWEKAGYASEGSCLEGMRAGWKRLHLASRSHSEAMSHENRRRRLYPDSPGTKDRAAYKRWLREKHREIGRAA